jgi:hypothetical protein
MREEFKPAIAALQSDLQDIEKKAAETKRAINRLCELAGAPPMYAVTDTDSSRPSVTTLRNDQFYGKVMNTAAREYLEMRKAANLGPATPREIYEALVTGGFKFDTKIETNAITGLRQILRKNSSIFHRLPHGAYGLLAWYPNAKAVKPDDDDDADSSDAAPRVQKTKLVIRPKPTKAKGEVKEPTPIHLGPFIIELMKDGTSWDVARLKTALNGKVQIPPDMIGRKVQGTLLNLASQKLIVNAGPKLWRHVTPTEIKTATAHEEVAVSKTAH